MSLAEVAFGSLMVYMGLRKLGNALSELRGAVNDVNKKTGKYAMRPCPGDGKGGLRCKITEGGSIERRAKIIADRIRKDSLDPRIRRLAVKAITEKCDGDQWCVPPRDGNAEIAKILADARNSGSPLARGLREIEGAYHYVRRQQRYLGDHLTHDTFVGAYRTLQDFHGGDCDDFTISLGALLRSVGYPEKLRVFWLKGDKEPGHIALRVSPDKKGKSYITLDASVDHINEGGRTSAPYPGWQATKRQVDSWKDYDV